MITEQITVENLPVSEIYSDSTFNVRGHISGSDVVELARNIDQNGLLQPITVQPYTQKPGVKWRIVTGHRRFMAFRALERDTIPAIIKDNLTDLQALAFNLIENINRKDLNIVQEANGLARFKNYGLTLDQTSRLINKSKGWIQVRFQLLELPPEIQQECEAGLITQEQIRDIAAIGNKEQQFEAVRRIKDARIAGEKRALKVKDRKADPNKRKRRDQAELSRMLGHVLDTIGACLLTRGLAWANGDVSDIELHRDLREYAKEQGLHYEVPEEILPYMSAG